jgi:hypothetical protein
VIGGTADWQYPGNSGVAFRGSFNWPSDTPCFVFSAEFNGAPRTTGEMASHEVGQTMGLTFQGTTTGTTFYAGHGSLDTSWAPILGNPLHSEVTQWAKGEYPNANSTQDELAAITGGYSNSYGTNGISYRTDLVGDTRAAATAITMSSRTAGIAEGIIERNTDVDMYRFTTGPGDITLTINPAAVGANLDIQLAVLNSAGAVLSTWNPASGQSSSSTATGLNASGSLNLAAGTYYVRVDDSGYANPLTTGYSTYGSAGAFTVRVD